MKTRTLKQLLLYNYRYLFAYLIIAGFFAYFLGWQLGQIGPGLSSPEIATAARHVTFGEIIKLPIYPLHSVLQWGSISILGINTVALRLPSVIIAITVAIVLYCLLKKLFGRQTALLSTAILISSDWYLFTARLGTGSIELSLWLAIGLLCFTKLLEHKTKWLLMFSASLAALLFTPLGPYVCITLLASLLYCRVFRERALEATYPVKIASLLILFTGVATAVYFSITNSLFLKNILGITELTSIAQYINNVVLNTAGIVAVLPNGNPMISPTGVFFVRFFELVFILFGVVMLWRTRVNRLNLTILIVTVVLVFTSGFSSGSRGGSAVLVPAAIFMTAGIRHLMHRWKRTFPKNPYARVAAFLPLGILFISVVSLHYFSYFLLWPSQTTTHQAFKPDIPLAINELNKSTYINKQCFVETEDTNIQTLLIASKTTCKVVFEKPIDKRLDFAMQLLQPTSVVSNTETDPVRAILSGKQEKSSLVRPLVSETKENNVRWLVVTNTP